MDKYITVDGFGIRFTDSSKNWPYTVEAKAMEESLANAITLDAFGKHALFKDYRYVRHYMDNMQSSLYKFGLWQERIHADWEKWRNHSKENSDELEKWFNDCFNDGKIIIPKEDYTPQCMTAYLTKTVDTMIWGVRTNWGHIIGSFNLKNYLCHKKRKPKRLKGSRYY